MKYVPVIKRISMVQRSGGELCERRGERDGKSLSRINGTFIIRPVRRVRRTNTIWQLYLYTTRLAYTVDSL